MIDLHCHVLPNIDDGPSSIEGSLAMCRMASADGIKIIVATPHFKPGLFALPSADEVAGAAALLNERIALKRVSTLRSFSPLRYALPPILSIISRKRISSALTPISVIS